MFWAGAGPASQSLTFIDRALGGPAPQALTFIDRAWASPAPQSLTFIDRKPSLLSTGPGQPGPQPLTSIGQTPHFYWPDPSLLLARPGCAMPDLVGPCQAVSAPCGTVPCQYRPYQRVGLALEHPW